MCIPGGDRPPTRPAWFSWPEEGNERKGDVPRRAAWYPGAPSDPPAALLRPFPVTNRLPRILDGLLALWRRPRLRLAVNLVAGIGFTAALVLAARQVAGTGWPLAAADPALAAGAGVLFLAGYAFKAYGWQRLFARGERPRTVSLAVAGGAACMTGLALPGRFDDVVRIAVARKAGCRSCVRTLCLTLFMLGLVDAIALTPLASTGAGLADDTALRVGLAVVAAGGVGAAIIVLALPRLVRSRLLGRFRVSRWVADHVIGSRDALSAGLFVSGSWLVRALALLLLLGALGIGFSVPLAILFLTAGAASSALPVAPAGAATQVGAGAAILVASGVKTSQAIAFAMSAQLLVIFAAAALVGGFVLWQLGTRARLRFAGASRAEPASVSV